MRDGTETIQARQVMSFDGRMPRRSWTLSFVSEAPMLGWSCAGDTGGSLRYVRQGEPLGGSEAVRASVCDSGCMVAIQQLSPFSLPCGFAFPRKPTPPRCTSVCFSSLLRIQRAFADA